MDRLNKAIRRELAEENPSPVNLIDELIKHAYGMQASDIHLEPNLKEVRVRLRVDGVLENAETLPKNIYEEIISRIKVLSRLRTDLHNTPQDGRWRNTLPSGEKVDLRVSIVPAFHGENVVLRLLSDNAGDFSLTTLGFSKSDQEKIKNAIKKTSGMILITGPTGSGKTTTLYTLIKMLNHPSISIVTIEDPIEYAIDGIEQIQVDHRTNLTFLNGLRSILRQDPNIIMVGEIRDNETASLAVNTALTGHLLLSTLHTNDAATTLPRLLDMKIESFLLSSTISLSISQRLVRKICPDCKEASKEDPKYFSGKGCNNCRHSGYLGRTVISEVMMVTPEIRQAILAKASAEEIKKVAVRGGMKTLMEDGLEKAQKGLTTLEEVLRVMHE